MFRRGFAVVACLAITSPGVRAGSQDVAQESATRETRVSGIVRDEQNAIALPGVPVSLVGSEEVVYTDMDGRYTTDDAEIGTHTINAACGCAIRDPHPPGTRQGAIRKV